MEEPRFKIQKTILKDFALFGIVDNKTGKVVCNLNYENGEEYCDEMAEKMVLGLNAAFSVPTDELCKQRGEEYEDKAYYNLGGEYIGDFEIGAKWAVDFILGKSN